MTSLGEVYLGNNVIDLRDGAWVLGSWDFEPFLGKTYLGGLVAMAPSGLFPKKHDWHMGLSAVRIVGMDDQSHFGLRVTFFGEAFLNFGWVGVVGMAAKQFAEDRHVFSCSLEAWQGSESCMLRPCGGCRK